MPKQVTPLNDTQIKQAKPQQQDYRLFDGGGLYLIIKAKGSKLWRFDYLSPVDNKRKTISFGTYPDVTLSKARELRNEARQKIADKIDPSNERKETKQQDKALKFESGLSLDNIFVKWFEATKHKRAITTNEKAQRAYEKDLAPWIGKLNIKQIKKAAVIECLKRVDSRTGGESARRLMMLCNQVWRYAVSEDFCEHNIIADIDASIVLKQVIHKQMAHITDEMELSKLLQAIDSYRGHFITICALKIAPLLIVRPLNIRLMAWSEIDFEKALWSIPAQKNSDGSRNEGYQNRMKRGEPHIVPLSKQALAILNEIRPLTGDSRFVFPATRGDDDKPLSENTLNGALSNMGYKNQTMHGIRHTASTILNESGLFRPDVIEKALAHNDKNSIRATYNKASYLEERKQLMQWWADYLDGLKGKVLAK